MIHMIPQNKTQMPKERAEEIDRIFECDAHRERILNHNQQNKQFLDNFKKKNFRIVWRENVDQFKFNCQSCGKTDNHSEQPEMPFLQLGEYTLYNRDYLYICSDCYGYYMEEQRK